MFKRRLMTAVLLVSVAWLCFGILYAQEEYQGALEQGQESMKQGLYEDAIDAFTGEIEYNPHDADAYVYRGYAYAQRGDFDRAIADYDKALGINSEYGEAYVLRAGAYLVEHDYDNAWYDIHKAESLGCEIPPDLLGDLKKMSEREE